MIQIIVRVSDPQKAGLLFEILSALNFVESMTLSNESSGIEQHYIKPNDSQQFAQRLKQADAVEPVQSSS